MTLSNRAFFTAGFFTQVRPLMEQTGGFFAGQDGAGRYACADATFFLLAMMVRRATKRFAEAGLALPASVRAIANGQIYKSSNFVFPAQGIWEGELVQDSAVRPGDLPSFPSLYAFCQWNGCAGASYGALLGNPSRVAPPYVNTAGR